MSLGILEILSFFIIFVRLVPSFFKNYYSLVSSILVQSQAVTENMLTYISARNFQYNFYFFYFCNFNSNIKIKKIGNQLGKLTRWSAEFYYISSFFLTNWLFLPGFFVLTLEYRVKHFLSHRFLKHFFLSLLR